MKANPTFNATASSCEDVANSATTRRGTLRPIALRWRGRFWRAFQRWWRRLWLDERTVYLSEATSHADLEHRIRAWEDDAQRRALLPFV